jgi:arogenate/prephenate dehydratase
VDAVRHVLSHSKVLDQCELYLNRLNAARTPANDTASAAHFIMTRNMTDSACIGSVRLAEVTGLAILERDIDDDPNSSTRYILLERDRVSIAPGIGCKTTLAVSLNNSPGALFRALACFAMRDINILKLETRPSARAGALHQTYRAWEYVNLVDVEGAQGEGRVARAIESLNEFANTVRVLGSYPVFTPGRN